MELDAWGLRILLVSPPGICWLFWRGYWNPLFKPLESVPDQILTLSVVLLKELASTMWGICRLILWGLARSFPQVMWSCFSNPGLVLSFSVLSTSFWSQMVVPNSFCPTPFSSMEEERHHLLCPVRAFFYRVSFHILKKNVFCCCFTDSAC